MNLNKTMAGYFSSHANVNEFFFCADGLAFFNAAAAQAHADALKSAGKSDAIQTVSRNDIEAWWATYAPQYAATCAANLTAATATLTGAEAALAGLPVKAATSKKAPYIKAVNDAKRAVAKATNVLAAANADAAAVAKKAALAAAEKKLQDDAATAGTTTATLDADKAAVDEAMGKLNMA